MLDKQRRPWEPQDAGRVVSNSSIFRETETYCLPTQLGNPEDTSNTLMYQLYQIYPHRILGTCAESGQVYWSKQTLLPINCRNSKLFPTMEPPQITSHPECGSQCNGRASASGHNPGNWNISYHKDKPGQCEKRSLFSELITCSVTGILITQSQAIQRPRGERFQCGPKDFPELQTGGPRSLVQVDNQS